MTASVRTTCFGRMTTKVGLPPGEEPNLRPILRGASGVCTQHSEDVVPARRCDLQGTLRVRLALDLRKVDVGRLRGYLVAPVLFVSSSVGLWPGGSYPNTLDALACDGEPAKAQGDPSGWGAHQPPRAAPRVGVPRPTP